MQRPAPESSWKGFARRKIRPALLLAAFAAVCAPLRAQDAKPPASIEELRAAIEDEIDKVGYGSAGVALVSKEKTIWADGIGLADAETGRRAGADTWWRVGSISKSFAAVAVLILEERGKLRLTDAVAELAPEIEIRNRWRDENPVRLAHLLEHTAGLDDLHFKDYASNDPTPLSLRQGLEHVRASLYCRWPPGLHSSYSNAGPAVAAYIVQKADGRPYEQFVADEILAPLGMDGAGLLLTDEIEAGLAAGYENDGAGRVPYWHIVARPSGALNATPAQMANFVRMLLNRGELDGRRLLSPQAVERMERPRTTLSARLPLDLGYGLGNYSQPADGFIFRGHNGGMPGYRAEYGYLPERGLGYCVMVSVSGGRLLNRVRDLVREYLVRGVEKPKQPAVGEMPGDIDRWTGYYRAITPRNESMRWAERFDFARVRRADDRLIVSRLFGRTANFVPVADRVFKRRGRPMTTLAFVEGPDGEKYMQGESGNRRKVSAAVVRFERGAAALAALLLLSAPAWALVWVPLKLLGKGKGRPVMVRVWPLLAMTALPAAQLVLNLGPGKLIERLGNPSPASIGFLVFSWLFALLSAWALLCALRSDPRRVGAFARRHAAAVSAACLAAAAYLLSYRAIGFPLWR